MSRVMTVSKARTIHGLPFSVSVVSWTLLLVLLLSSSFNHVHRSGKQDAEESITGRYELSRSARDAGARSHMDFHGSILDTGQGFSGDHLPSLQLAEAWEQDRLNTNSGYDLSVEENVLADRSMLSEDISTTPGASTVDALQYAEYGAGLLQNSGAAEESAKETRVTYLGGSHCPTETEHRGFTGQACALPRSDGDYSSWNEFSTQELGQHVDMVREVEPGESQFVCRRNTAAETASCYLAYSCITQCFKTRIDSRFCYYDDSLLKLLRSPREIHQNSAQYCLTCSDFVTARKTSEQDDIRSLDAELGQTDFMEAEEASRTSAVDRFNYEATDIYLPEDTRNSRKTETDVVDRVADGILPVTNEIQDVADKDDAQPSLEVNQKMDNQIYRSEDINVLSSTEVYTDSNTDSLIDEDKRLSGPARVNLGIVNVNEVLTEELQNFLNIQEEGPLDDKPITSAGLDSDLEPVRPRRVGSVMSLDEYKRSILQKQQKLGHDVNLSMVQSKKLRHSDESYNYADSSHGAKVLSSNKEAKGPTHIIRSDKDKYLRNPCSAEDKYVVLELSEETFVDTVVIANFEFHSANLKEFEVFGSPVYPAKEWILLGRFRAENVRHRQKFSIEDPKLVRYLKLKMLTHWGSEFFCTLSAVEVFGIDVIENLLDDWIAQRDRENVPRTQMTGIAVHHKENAPEALQGSVRSSDAASVLPLSSESSMDLATHLDAGSPEEKLEGSSRDEEPRVGVTVSEVHYPIGGKTPGDSVLKILMQKVKGLEASESLFHSYLEDMNVKYKAMLSELDKDLLLVTEQVRNEAAVSASLALRLAKLEVKRREEWAYMEHKFALIAANFSENIEFTRWQIQNMERREITAVMSTVFSLILSGLLHFVASCWARRASSRNCTLQTLGEDTDEAVEACNLPSVCNRSSSVILYLASGLTVLVLTV